MTLAGYAAAAALASAGRTRRPRAVPQATVRPAYRRNGLGGALFGQAVDLARTIGYSHLLLESPRSWAGAHAVYTRHGFAPVDAYPESEVPPDLKQYWIHMGRDL
jgi:GNAT superfamily N-acetyltransferase